MVPYAYRFSTNGTIKEVQMVLIMRQVCLFYNNDNLTMYEGYNVNVLYM